MSHTGNSFYLLSRSMDWTLRTHCQWRLRSRARHQCSRTDVRAAWCPRPPLSHRTSNRMVLIPNAGSTSASLKAGGGFCPRKAAHTKGLLLRVHTTTFCVGCFLPKEQGVPKEVWRDLVVLSRQLLRTMHWLQAQKLGQLGLLLGFFL